MPTSWVTGLVLMVALLVGWVGVQLAWRRVFGETSSDPDALAGRLGCHGCGCTDACERGLAGETGAGEEGTT